MKKKIVIFGCSGYGQQFNYLLDPKKYEVIAYIDNNADIQGQKFYGIDVLRPEAVCGLEFDKIVISLSEYDRQIRKQLEGIGIEDWQIETFQPQMTGIDCQELRYGLLRCCMEQITERKIMGSMAELGVYKGEFPPI